MRQDRKIKENMKTKVTMIKNNFLSKERISIYKLERCFLNVYYVIPEERRLDLCG